MLSLPLSASAAALALLLAALGAGGALAQNETYRLTDGDDWADQTQPPADEDEALIRDARRALAEDRPGEARNMLDDWIRTHDRSGSQWLPTAYRLRGDAKRAQGDEFKALYDYESVIRGFPGSDEFVIAIEREVDIAVEYANGKKRKAFGLRIESGGDTAVEIFIRANERLPGSALAERALVELADYYFRRREMDLASEAYGIYLINFPEGPNRLHAKERQIYASIATFNGPRYDATGLRDAREQVRRFELEYPAVAKREGLDESLLLRMDEAEAAAMLETARWYLRVDDHAAAKLTLTRLLMKFPRTVAADTGLTMLENRGWLPPSAAEPEPPAPEETPLPSEAASDDAAPEGAP